MDATRHPDDGDGSAHHSSGPAFSHQNTLGGSGRNVFQFRDSGDITVNYGISEPFDSTPMTVPAAPSVFVNRTAELDGLDAATTIGTGTPIAVCTGLPGIGKSAAIRTWAARTRDRFPGGQLYVDFAELPGVHGSRDPKDAIARVLHSLGVSDEFMPETMERMNDLFHSRTAKKATLVVVEGVGEPAPVRQLVPSAPGSAVVVAADSAPLDELSLNAARFVAFDPLGSEAGRSLLAEICGPDRISADPTAADRIVVLCGGHPLALMVCAARLSRQPRLSPADLAAELTNEDRRLSALSLRGDSAVTAAFNTSYRALPDEDARAYRLLGLWPGARVNPGVAAVAVADAEAVCTRLERAGLLEPCAETEGGLDSVRFRHDLVRLHARDRAMTEEPVEERHRVLRRYLERYLAWLAHADMLVMGKRLRIADNVALTATHQNPFDSRHTAMRWLHAERASIVAAANASVRADLPDLAWPIAEAATALYLNHRFVHDWEETGRLGADAARDAGHPWAEARLRSLLSRPLTDLNRLDDAGAQVRRAATLVADCPDLRLRASVAEFRGRYLDHVDPERAIVAHRESQELNERADEPRGAALARLFLGSSLSRSGRHVEAFPHLQEALAWFRESDERRMVGRALLALGQAYTREGVSGLARENLEEAVEVLHGHPGPHHETHARSQNPHYEAQAREALADLLKQQGDREAERTHLKRALVLHTAHGSPRVHELAHRLDGAG